jgi:hypothetical protein
MDWNEFLLLLQLATAHYCEKEQDKFVKPCIETIRECVLDGESFKWCTQNWEEEKGNGN